MPAVWEQLDALAATKTPARNAQAVALLADLREFEARGDLGDFEAGMLSFRVTRAMKPALLRRLDKAGL